MQVRIENAGLRPAHSFSNAEAPWISVKYGIQKPAPPCPLSRKRRQNPRDFLGRGRDNIRRRLAPAKPGSAADREDALSDIV